ncbi:MAG: putative rane protein [Rhodocyclales bacterium]|nr:putative rane protein [Rhodocyclales bacterium]
MPSVPYLGIGAHVLVAIFFAIHALRTGRNVYWLFILFAFPLLGSIVYFFVEFLPEIRGSRAVNATGKAVRSIISPGRALREAERAVELSPSADNRIRLASALFDTNRLDEAVVQYQSAAVGLHEFDPALNLGLARTLLAQQRAIEARAVIERYMHQEKNRLPGDLPLLYARTLAACNDREAALTQFERVVAEDPSPEARSRYGEYLHGIGQDERAREILQAFMADVKHWPRNVHTLNREWIALAEGVLRQL